MKYRILLPLLLLFIIEVTFAQQQYDFTVALSEPSKRGTLHVDLKKGPVTVKGTTRQDILVKYQSMEDGNVKMTATGKGGMKKISGGIAGLEATEKNNAVYIESENWNKGVILYIEIPRNFDLELQSYNEGDIKVENVAGELTIETYNGDITATDVAGSVIANTFNGPIKVTFTQVNASAPMTFFTYNGDVDITLPTGTKANLKMKSEQGDVYTDFDMQVTKNEPVKKEGEKNKMYISGWVSGTINGGGPELKMQNWNGDIYIRKK